MAEPMSGLDMVREIIGQINNLRKLVTVNGKTYKYDQKSKSYKADGKSFTPSQLKTILKGQSFKAPKIDNKSKLKVNKTKPKSTQTKTTPKSTQTKTKGPKIADPWRGTYSTPKENLKINKDIKARKKGFFEKYGITNKDIKNVERTGKKKDGTYKMSRATKAQVNQSNYGRKNAALAILGKAADWGVDQLVDRGARQIAGKSKMTLEEFRKARDKGELKGTLRSKPKDKGTPLTGDKELSTSIRGKQKKNQPTTSNKEIKVKPKTQNPKFKNTVGGDSTSTTKKKLTPAQKEAKAKEKWLKDTRNSPAQKSKAFSKDQLWEAQKRHREWKKKNKRK